MARIDKGLNVAGKSTPSGAFWAAFGLVIAGLFVGQFVSFMITIVFGVFNGVEMADLFDKPEVLTNSLSQTQYFLAQASYTFIFTFLTPWAFLKLNNQPGFGILSTEKKLNLVPALLSFLAIASFLLVNSYLAEWNSGLRLPEALSALEKIMMELEEAAAEITERLTTFSNFGAFLLAFTVIAVLPGIGEELLFRGVLQNTLHRYTNNKHIAIWVTAFIFAAIHFQFYGIAPRTALGILFGYIYVWSGNLRLAMIAHIANNGLTLCIVYYVQLTNSDFDIDNAEGVEWWASLIAFAVTCGLLFLFRNHYLRSNSTNEQVADDLSDQP